MKNEKPLSKSRLALMRKVENRIREAEGLLANYNADKKTNPKLNIPFLEDHTPSPPPEKTRLSDVSR